MDWGQTERKTAESEDSKLAAALWIYANEIKSAIVNGKEILLAYKTENRTI